MNSAVSGPSTSSASSSLLGGGDDDDNCGMRCSNAATSSSSTAAAISIVAGSAAGTSAGESSCCIGPTIGTDSVTVVGTEHVRWLAEPTLDRPVLIAGFTGWNDAGDAASTAMTTMVEAWDADVLAEIDPESFTDFATVRPAGATRRRPQPIDRVADRRRVVGVAPRHRRHPRARPRTRTPLAALLRTDHRHRRSFRGDDGDLARCTARRRPALAAGPADRHGIRRFADRAIRTPALAVRGARRASSESCTTLSTEPVCRQHRCGPPCPATHHRSRRRRPQWRWSTGRVR